MAYLKCILFLQLLCQTGDGNVAGRGCAASPSEDQAIDDGGDGDEEEDDDFERPVVKSQKRKKKPPSTDPLPPPKKTSVKGVKASSEPG